MPTTDSLGTWNSIGTIEPSWEDWLFFPGDIIDSETLRFTFACDWIKRFNLSYGILRFHYPTTEATVSPVVRTWPQAEKLILVFPIPQEFKENGIVLRKIAIKKIFRRDYFNPNYDPPWTLTIEALT